ncbi:MAG: ABC transporter permease [Fastidiosipilaceae bacterium]|jgi:peptide/nickel transport system permease protein
MSSITKVILNHVLRGLLILIGVTMLSFLLGQLAPGDAAYAALGSDAADAPTEEELEAVREELGLNDPLHQQYTKWFKSVLKGNFGTSFMTSRSIKEELVRRIPVTLKLSGFAFVLLLFSLPLGFMLALHKDSIFDRLFLWFSSIFSAIPGFLVAIALMLLFAQTLRLLPTSGMNGFKSLILPAVSISLSSTMMITRMLRADLLERFNSPYFEMARSKGFSFRFATFKHLLPHSCSAILPFWSNYLLGILGGSTVAESIFALPGMGEWILKSIHSHDYPAIQAYVLVMGLFCWVIFIVTDIIQLALQPQLRRS